MTDAERLHNDGGNCWSNEATYECDVCGPGSLCDVCHDHDEPRGECSACKRCPRCENTDTRKPPTDDLAAPPKKKRRGRKAKR